MAGGIAARVLGTEVIGCHAKGDGVSVRPQIQVGSIYLQIVGLPVFSELPGHHPG